MKFLLLALVTISLFSIGFSDEVLPISIADFTQKTLHITNCKTPSGGPSVSEVSVNVDNPLPVQLRVSYQYFDPPLNTFVDQPMSTYCYISPSSTRTCKFTVFFRYGGHGNGTIDGIELLRITGRDVEGKNPTVYTSSLKFDVDHLETIQETNVFNKIHEARGFLSQMTEKLPCFGDTCCGMDGALSKVDKAKLDIANAEEHLKLCNITTAYSFASSAYQNSKSALSSVSTNTESCQEALAGYKEAKSDVDDADKTISNLVCEPDQSALDSLEKAKTKLANSKILIGNDDYEAAALEMENAKRVAATAKSSAKCASGAPAGTGSPGAGQSGQTNGGASQGGQATSGSPPPLCPLGMAVLALVGLGAFFAYSKK
ncbi:MAG: hypothetical protein ABIF01_04275 [Candidatus Micrarchaeota archaeon]